MAIAGEGQLETEWVYESPYQLSAKFNLEEDKAVQHYLKSRFLKHVVDTEEIPGLSPEAVEVFDKGNGSSRLVISGKANIEKFVELNCRSMSLRKLFGYDPAKVSTYESGCNL